MLAFPFGAPNLQGTVTGVIKAGMFMQNIKGPFQALCGRDIRVISHPHHKTFGMGMGRIGVAAYPAVKILGDIAGIVVPVRRHGQRIPDKQAPQSIFQATFF
jgi:hypothetical protein